MATESELRDLLQGPDPEGRGAIDIDAVLTRARRRRRPRVIVAQALGSVAAVGVLVTGVAVTLPQTAPVSLLTAEGSAEDAAGGSEEYASTPQSPDADASLRLPAESCGAAYVEPPATAGWSLELAPLETSATDALAVPVTLRNLGDTPLSGLVSPPRIVLTQGGVVVGYAPAVDSIATRVELEPGGTAVFDALVVPVACDPADPGTPLEELPVLPPGDYEMRPVLVLTDEAGELSTVAGTATPLVIG